MYEYGKNYLLNKRIYLYGDMERIGKFLEKNKETIPVYKVASDHENDIRMQDFSDYGIETVYMKEAEEDDKAYFLLCNCYLMGKRRLEYLGKKEYQDFISDQLIEAFFQEKKILLAMGTSLIRQVFDRIKIEKEISGEYSLIFFPDDWLLQPYQNKLEEYIHISRYCNIYICSSSEKKRYRSKKLQKERLPRCEHYISVSDYGFRAYFPTVDPDRDYISDYFLREHDREERIYETICCAREDKYIVRSCSEKQDPVMIMKRMLSPDLLSEEFIKSGFEKEIERWEELEKNDTIKLSGFIRNNYRSCVCRNLDEWSPDTVRYICSEIAGILGFRLSADDTEACYFAGTELPILPCVEKALKLEGLDNKEYYLETFTGSKKLNISQYIEYLTRYTIASMDLMSYTGMDRNIQLRNKKTGPAVSVLDYVDATAWNTGNTEGMMDENDSVIYRYMKLWGQSLGTAILKTDLRKKPVAVIIKREIHMVPAFIGVMYSGNHYVPVDTGLSDEDIVKIANELSIDTFIADEDNQNRIRGLFPEANVFVYENELMNRIDQTGLDQVRSKISNDDLMCIYCDIDDNKSITTERFTHKDVIDHVEENDPLKTMSGQGSYEIKTRLSSCESLYELYTCIKGAIILSWDR